MDVFQPNHLSETERGNALLYVLLAVGLLGALTYFYAEDSRENYSSQAAISISENLYAQANMIKSAVVQCTLEYPAGAVLNGNIVNNPATDNPNTPYPIAPSSALNASRQLGNPPVSDPIAAAANDQVRNLTCIGAPSSLAFMFTGANNQGRYLPPIPSDFTDWVYGNDLTSGPSGKGGVYIQTTGNGDAASVSALQRLIAKYVQPTQASLSGNTITIWILNNN